MTKIEATFYVPLRGLERERKKTTINMYQIFPSNLHIFNMPLEMPYNFK